MTQTDIISVRGALINHIIKTLEPHKFQRSDDVFESLRYMVRPGRRIIINGVIHDEEPIRIPFILHIELHGTGHVISPDGKIEPFELISFGVKVGDEYRGEHTNVYYDTVQEFNKHLKNYFNLI